MISDVVILDGVVLDVVILDSFIQIPWICSRVEEKIDLDKKKLVLGITMPQVSFCIFDNVFVRIWAMKTKHIGITVLSFDLLAVWGAWAHVACIQLILVPVSGHLIWLNGPGAEQSNLVSNKQNMIESMQKYLTAVNILTTKKLQSKSIIWSIVAYLKSKPAILSLIQIPGQV